MSAHVCNSTPGSDAWTELCLYGCDGCYAFDRERARRRLETARMAVREQKNASLDCRTEVRYGNCEECASARNLVMLGLAVAMAGGPGNDA